jgi:hypothetical protein
MRVYETVTMHLHERAANSFLRAQAIVDTVSAGKMAAVAASAAAVAGGGFAVEGVVSTPGERPASLLRGARDIASLPAVQHGSQPRAHQVAKTRSHPKPRARPRATAKAPAKATPARQQARQSTTRTTVVASAPRASAASTGGASRTASAASSEFGFEGP